MEAASPHTMIMTGQKYSYPQVDQFYLANAGKTQPLSSTIPNKVSSSISLKVGSDALKTSQGVNMDLETMNQNTISNTNVLLDPNENGNGDMAAAKLYTTSVASIHNRKPVEETTSTV